MRAFTWRRLVSGLIVGLFVALPIHLSAATTTHYWDTNLSAAGCGDVGGSWSGSNWTTDPSGQSATGSWVPGSDAVFSAGTDGTGAIGVTVAGTPTLHNLAVSAGSVTLSGGGLLLSSLTTSATWTTSAGATLDVQSPLNANGNVLTVGGGGSTTFDGTLTTTRGLNVSGGTVVLAANNPLTGGVAVEVGTLSVRNSAALGPGGSGNDTIVTPGATLELSDTSGISINNVTLTVGGSGTSGAGAVRVAQGNCTWTGPVLLSADTLINTTSGSLTLSNYLLGGFNITKAGSGTLALGAANAAGFLGSIAVKAGTLEVSSATALGLSVGGGTVSVSSGATLALHGGINIPPEPIILSGIGLAGAGALLNRADANSLAGQITVNSSNTQIGVASGTLFLSGGITGSGGIVKSGSGVLALTSTSSNYAGPLTVAGGTLVVPLINGSNASGPLGSSSTAVSLAAAATLDYTGPTAASNRGFTLMAGGMSSFQIDGAATNLNLGGSLAGGGGLAKTGPGTLTLSASNSYAGSTFVSSGTVAIAATGSINSSAGVTIAQGATLAIINGGANQLSSSASVTLSGGTLIFTGNGAFSAPETAGVLILASGQSSLTANQTGPPTYTPAIRFSGNQSAPILGATATFAGNQAAFEFQSAPTLIHGILGGGAYFGSSGFATCTTTAPYTVVPFSGYTTGDLGAIVADATLNLKLSGTQSTLGSVKAFNSLNLTGSAGVTMSNGGSLALTSGGIIANTSGTISGGTLAGSLDGSLIVNAVQNFSIDSLIADNGGATALVKTGTGTLTLTAVNTFTGDTYLNQGVLQISPTANFSYNGVIRGVGSLTKSGTSTLTLAGTNTFTGNTTLAGGGLCVNGSLAPGSTLTMQGGTVLSGSGMIGGNVVSSGGVIAFSSTAASIAGSVTVSSGTLSVGKPGLGNYLATTGGLTVSGSSVLVASPSTSATIVGNVAYTSSANSNYSGVISGSASVLTVNAPAATTLTLSNSTADFLAGTVVQSGILKIANSAALFNSNMTINGGRLDMNGLNQSFADLAGSGGTISTSQAGTLMLTVAPPSGVSSQYAGSIANGNGTVALRKTNPGTLVLSGSNGYTGGTIVTEGNLVIANSGALAAGTSLVVGSSAGLIFAGQAAEIALPVEKAAAVSPVPEPGSIVLLLVAFGVLAARSIARAPCTHGRRKC